MGSVSSPQFDCCVCALPNSASASARHVDALFRCMPAMQLVCVLRESLIVKFRRNMKKVQGFNLTTTLNCYVCPIFFRPLDYCLPMPYKQKHRSISKHSRYESISFDA